MGNGRCCWHRHSGPTHSDLAAREEKDPEGGPFPAYPSGKTWDEPSGKTGSGKKFFHNIIDGSKVGVFFGGGGISGTKNQTSA